MLTPLLPRTARMAYLSLSYMVFCYVSQVRTPNNGLPAPYDDISKSFGVLYDSNKMTVRLVVRTACTSRAMTAAIIVE